MTLLTYRTRHHKQFYFLPFAIKLLQNLQNYVLKVVISMRQERNISTSKNETKNPLQQGKQSYSQDIMDLLYKLKHIYFFTLTMSLVT